MRCPKCDSVFDADYGVQVAGSLYCSKECAAPAPAIRAWGCAGLVFVAAGLAFLASHEWASSSSPSAPVAEPSPTPPDAPTHDRVAMERAEKLAAANLGLAISMTKPRMQNSVNVFDDGTSEFAAWALLRMTWDDVGVRVDEVTPAEVMKDSDASRGKRLCVKGTIVEIAAFTAATGKGFAGALFTPREEFVKLIAVGSSGTLVRQNPARFCGVTTGIHSYENVMGTQTRAVMMVGMFDLPENRTAAK